MRGDELLARVAAVRTAGELAECLAELRRSQYPPLSLRELEQWGMGHRRPLPTSTVHDVLKGVRPPRPSLLRDLLAAFQVHDERQVRVWLEALERVAGDRGRGRDESAARFFAERQDVNDVAARIGQAREEVWLWGAVLPMYLPFLRPFVHKALTRGVRVRVLLITRAGAAMTMAAFRSADSDIGRLREALDNNLDILHGLEAEFPGLCLRQIDYLPPYTLYAYDPGLPDGRMDLRLMSFHGDYDLRPSFSVQRARDGEWFGHFHEQFTLVWQNAESG
ncbi:hypothetical protein [Spongiactinospora rosea]|uniref:hypothetical protein n=1 Tax=Spongiactinospora rosea TaxID=2248750 RepID=UPI0011C06472|nr:hypothetical protein [Spongiactinospora rosea]